MRAIFLIAVLFLFGPSLGFGMSFSRATDPLMWRGDSNNFGFRYQFDHWTDVERFNIDKVTRHWVSFQVFKSFFHDEFEGRFFVFRSVKNRDLWIRPRVVWRCEPHLTVQLTFDKGDGGDLGDQYLGAFADQDRFWTKVEYFF